MDREVFREGFARNIEGSSERLRKMKTLVETRANAREIEHAKGGIDRGVFREGFARNIEGSSERLMKMKTWVETRTNARESSNINERELH